MTAASKRGDVCTYEVATIIDLASGIRHKEVDADGRREQSEGDGGESGERKTHVASDLMVGSREVEGASYKTFVGQSVRKRSGELT